MIGFIRQYNEAVFVIFIAFHLNIGVYIQITTNNQPSNIKLTTNHTKLTGTFTSDFRDMKLNRGMSHKPEYYVHIAKIMTSAQLFKSNDAVS